MKVQRRVSIHDGDMYVYFTINGSSLIMRYFHDGEDGVRVYLPSHPFLMTYKSVGHEDLEGVMRFPLSFLPPSINFDIGRSRFYFPVNGEVKTTLVKLTKVVLQKVQLLCAFCERLERERNLSSWVWKDVTWEVSGGMIERDLFEDGE